MLIQADISSHPEYFAMIRIVLAETDAGHWKTYRQPQWIGQVRDRPEAAGWVKVHYDIEEEAYKGVLARWLAEELGRDRVAAEGALVVAGATVVPGPGRG